MKKLSDIVDKIKTDEYTFKIRRIVAEFRIRLDPERLKFNLFETLENYDASMIRRILEVATMEEPIREIPADWFQHFKLRWFPRWLKKRFPIRTVWVVAIHKFPELQMPQLGREFIHLTVVDTDKLMKELGRDDSRG